MQFKKIIFSLTLSVCLLLSGCNSTSHVDDINAEFEKFTLNLSDGFKIAEEDLRLRGPGDFFGERQHGLPGLRIADIGCDTKLLQEAQQAAEALLEKDPDLTGYPATAERVSQLFTQRADTLN